MENYDKGKSSLQSEKMRLYDKNGFSLRGSCVVWDSDKKENTLLIKNKKGIWGIPGGGIEKFDNTFLSGALRELKEEAGIIGLVIDYVGNFKDNIGKNKHNTFVWNVIPIEELQDYKENHRERKWFTFKDACEQLISKPVHQNILINSKKNNMRQDKFLFDSLKHEYDIWKNINRIYLE